MLATVKGDVHDIGKNLVDIILTNNGYEVVNLGIKVPISEMVDKAVEVKADAIGMSGLLVKSTLIMRENLAEMNERGLAGLPRLVRRRLGRRGRRGRRAPSGHPLPAGAAGGGALQHLGGLLGWQAGALQDAAQLRRRLRLGVLADRPPRPAAVRGTRQPETSHVLLLCRARRQEMAGTTSGPPAGGPAGEGPETAGVHSTPARRAAACDA